MTEQGIRISFLSNAVEGDRVHFYGTLNGIQITYNNGLNNVDFEFTNNDSEITSDPLHRVKIGSTIEETANNVKYFLDNNGYVSSSIPIYNKTVFSGTIWNVESIYTANDRISFEFEVFSDNISIVSFYGGVIPVTAPKYYFEYTNLANDFYRCEIYQSGFGGTPTEITGTATIEKNDVKDHLDPIRGTGLSLQILASEDLSFDDFYTEKQGDFTVKFYRSTILIFQGFILAEGLYQSYTSDIWMINVKCVDGLGLISDLSFVKESGAPFSGRMTCMDIIYNCLKRTGIQLKIRSFIDVFYYGIIDNIYTDVLTNANLNVDRFKKSDDNTLMSCQEVLLSVLNLFNACITQEEGEWHIYRPMSFYTNQYPQFKRYEIDNSFMGLNTINLNRSLGSHGDNYYPHHAGYNQRVEIRGAISAFRLGYKYGFIGSLLGNGSLTHVAGTKIYENWDVQTWTESLINGSLVIDPNSTLGISFKAATTLGSPRVFNEALISDVSITLEKGYTFDFKTRFISYGFPVAVRFSVRVGDYYLNWIDGSWDDSSALYFDLVNASVNEFPNNTGELVDAKYDRTFTINSQPLPELGDVEIIMFVPQKVIGGSDVPLVEVKSIELINTFQGNNVVGEFHTVSRINPVSSIVKENGSVNNGDNTNDVYLGAIYMSDKITLTKQWYRGQFGGSEVKPILRILAEDELRMAQIPTQLFSGDLYGYFSYLGVYNINKFTGKFMPISYSFDTYNNKGTAKFLELYSPEVYDIEYNKTDDYGETVKPTIVG